MKVILIAAVAANNVIGRKNGEMPWHLPEDFEHFKKTTSGFPVIMGRKTFFALGKPLKKRLNIVVTRNAQGFAFPEDVVITPSLGDALQTAAETGTEKAFIMGGGEIYAQAIGIADEMIISHLEFSANGEVHFPIFSESEWVISKKVQKDRFIITYYKRQRTVHE